MASKKMIVMTLILGLVALATGCSDTTTATAPDTAPPTPASNVTVAYVAGVATVTWSISAVDADLAGYVVTREHNGDTVELLGAPTLVTVVDDAAPDLGYSVYHVYAVDTSGNESAPVSANLQVTAQRGDLHPND